MCNTKWLAARFKDDIIKQPSLRIWEIHDMCGDKLGLYVGRTICYRAKMKILKESMSDWNSEFARLCDYADIIKQTNPGSSAWVRMDRESCPGKNLFVYFYVCLDALKKDGWKGACKGELLVTVGKNGNNQMFPIAWAVVDSETKHSWSFFINYLKKDLQLGTGEGLTVMADMQKGSHAAVEELLPNAEHTCIRHIWSNWHQQWKGEERRKQFWRCSKASFEVKFRHKSIITMLEEIRRKIMIRQCDMIKFANTWISEISPMARLTLEDNKEMSRGCKVLWNVDIGFEIGEGEDRHTVNMSTKSCSCRTWQLREIPCQHAVCAYYHIELEPEHFAKH
ncbi:uncharacterized protein LOC132624261 [Lycium barbarum]|uniref:uncharacterized protein LOC132624261 n=1 Tax=Lycium barbarum TaxID=112863 RepID=UPI00293E5656|nr:uncharacterized protein LOC132624261 [Lycium barbarum]